MHFYSTTEFSNLIAVFFILSLWKAMYGFNDCDCSDFSTLCIFISFIPYGRYNCKFQFIRFEFLPIMKAMCFSILFGIFTFLLKLLTSCVMTAILFKTMKCNSYFICQSEIKMIGFVSRTLSSLVT